MARRPLQFLFLSRFISCLSTFFLPIFFLVFSKAAGSLRCQDTERESRRASTASLVVGIGARSRKQERKEEAAVAAKEEADIVRQLRPSPDTIEH